MSTYFPALVLSRTGTGLAVIRCLSAANIAVHAAIFTRHEAVNYTRLAKKIVLAQNQQNDTQLIRWIIDYARSLDDRPMLFPTSDTDALLIAKHREELAPHCRVWNNTYADLLNIVDKEKLYRLAAANGVQSAPSLYHPTPAELNLWTENNPGPYLVKPGYENAPSNKLGKKNLCFAHRSELLAWATQTDLQDLIIQRRLRGGDGNIFDCYGLCDATGRIVTTATHRRWRQHLPDVGATSLGEIPAGDTRIEALIVERTQQLLSTIKYHGIFGIEWLHEVNSGNVYLIDFNARPFSTISHLADCGLNLPHLAVAEMAGEDISRMTQAPALQRKLWVDFVRDFETCTLKREKGELSLGHWLRSVLSCRSFAYWNWRDPGPGLYQAYLLLQRLSRKGWRAAIALAQLIPLDI